jgi:hypothetical protein
MNYQVTWFNTDGKTQFNRIAINQILRVFKAQIFRKSPRIYLMVLFLAQCIATLHEGKISQVCLFNGINATIFQYISFLEQIQLVNLKSTIQGFHSHNWLHIPWIEDIKTLLCDYYPSIFD